MATLPAYVKPTADVLHAQVAHVRKGAALMDVDLSDLTDLEVLAILRWCKAATPAHLNVVDTMHGLLATMGGVTA